MRVVSFFRRLWNGETEGVAGAAALIGIASLASRILGVLRDRLLATQFGAGLELDVYYTAFRLPDFIYNLVIVGALSAGFIPLFTELRERNTMKDALRFTSQALSLVGTALVVLCAVGMVAASVIVPWLAPGFDGDKQAITVTLTQIMFLSPLFLGISAVMGGVLQSTKRFFAFAFAPLFYNAGIIFGILVCVPFLGLPGLAWGVVLGAFLHGFVQYAAVRPLGGLSLPFPSLAPEAVRRMIQLMIPRTAGLAVTQVNLIIILFFASALAEGSVSVFHLAGNLQSLPLGLIGVSFAVAAFPVLAEAAGTQRMDLFFATLKSATRRILYFILPLCVVCLMLRAQIVRVVLGDGQFGWEDTRRTLEVFALLVIALPAQALSQLYTRAFFAVQSAWTPFAVACASALTTSVLAWQTYQLFGIHGLAWAVVAGAIVQVLLLYVFLWKKVGFSLFTERFPSFVLRLGVALFAQAVVTYGVNYGIGTALSPLTRAWMVLLQGATAGITGGIVFLYVTHLLKLPESALIGRLTHALSSFRKKWMS